MNPNHATHRPTLEEIVIQGLQRRRVYETSIQEWEQMLLAKDPQTVRTSALAVYSWAKQSGYAHLLAEKPKMIEAIVATMIVGRESCDFDLLKSTLGTLSLFSNTYEAKPHGFETILRSDAIPHLVAILSGYSEELLYLAVTILHNMLSHHPASRQGIRSTDAVPILVQLLEQNDEKLLAIVIDNLRMLAHMHPETMLFLHKRKVHVHLIRILNNSTHEKLLWMTSRLIQALCDSQHNKRAIIQAGGIRALIKHFSDNSLRLILTCLKALDNLSSAAVFVNDLDRLLNRLIQYLGNSDQEVLDTCLGILNNLSCKKLRNKKYLCENSGVESLIRVLITHWSHPSIATNAMGTLRHLICRSQFALQTWHWPMEVQLSRNKLRRLGCIQMIGRYLDTQQFLQHPEVTSEALALLRNFASGDGASWEEFRQYQIVEAVANVSCEIYSNGLIHQAHLSNDYTEILDRALTTLSFLCQCGENRRILSEHTNLENMANEMINNPDLVPKLKETASNFLTALHAPPQIEAAPMGVDMGAMAIEQNLHD